MPDRDSTRPRAASPGRRFRRQEHLLLRRDFDRVFEAGCRVADEWLTLFACPNDGLCSRLGISAGTRLGGATDRNYVKRRIREAFRTQKRELPNGFDFVCVARPAAVRHDIDIAASLHKLCLRAVQKWRQRDDAAHGRAPGSAVNNDR